MEALLLVVKQPVCVSDHDSHQWQLYLHSHVTLNQLNIGTLLVFFLEMETVCSFRFLLK